MKIAARLLSLMVLVSLAAFYVACDDENGGTADVEDEQIEKLNGTWNVVTATLDGAPPSLDHSNMTITITGTTGANATSVSYTISGRPAGPSPWPPSGTFEFGTDPKQNFVREDDIDVNYSVTETSLVLNFTFDGTPYTAGRTSNVSGEWHFEFEKQ